MKFRRLSEPDLPGVLALQEANLFENLPESRRVDGFLSARFSAAQFVEMDRSAAVVVAEEDAHITGYACCAGIDYSLRFPILAAMAGTFNRTTFLGNPLADAATCIYGPACVDAARRGHGVLRGLVGGLKQALAGRFDVAAGFIAKSNVRSLAAHVDGLGMTLAGDFEFSDKAFWIVCFGIPAADLACGTGPRPG